MYRSWVDQPLNVMFTMLMQMCIYILGSEHLLLQGISLSNLCKADAVSSFADPLGWSLRYITIIVHFRVKITAQNGLLRIMFLFLPGSVLSMTRQIVNLVGCSCTMTAILTSCLKVLASCSAFTWTFKPYFVISTGQPFVGNEMVWQPILSCIASIMRGL